ncbi:hypothetical protein [Alicyclobacillus acidocaldarius]|nr:hypothetical protein [Alicyclobacillus acidocaldarius]
MEDRTIDHEHPNGENHEARLTHPAVKDVGHSAYRQDAEHGGGVEF